MTRPCSRCGSETAPEDLARKSARSLRTWCRKCDSRRSRAYYYGHWHLRRDVNNARRRQQYQANKPAAESG